MFSLDTGVTSQNLETALHWEILFLMQNISLLLKLELMQTAPKKSDVLFHWHSDVNNAFDVWQMMKQRHKIEREANIGEEVGWTKNQEVAKANPKLAAMNKKFGMIHGLSSLANIFSFGCLAMHSWYLAGKLNL